jgi:hypothetical protein
VLAGKDGGLPLDPDRGNDSMFTKVIMNALVFLPCVCGCGCLHAAPVGCTEQVSARVALRTEQEGDLRLIELLMGAPGLSLSEKRAADRALPSRLAMQCSSCLHRRLPTVYCDPVCLILYACAISLISFSLSLCVCVCVCVCVCACLRVR